MRKLLCALMAALLVSAGALPVMAETMGAVARIKDVAKVQGVRANQLLGYGLVVGLAGTGDSSTKSIETMQSIASMLRTFGVTVPSSQMQSKNVAAVMVTAQLPPFAKPGDTIDITGSSMGDSKSLQGGTLLQTPLRAANGQVYAVGQGPVSTGGFVFGSGCNSQQKNFPTVGTMPNGAIVEKDVPMQFSNNGTVTLSLAQPDFTTATRIGDAINYRFGAIATARDPGTVVIAVPAEYQGDGLVGFVASLEELSIVPDNAAKIVINERTGTIVMGANVAIDSVAVTQGGLTIKISKSTDVSQPPPLSRGTTTTTTNTNVSVEEDKGNTILLPSTANVGDVVNALNAVGATPRDVISILQAIKAAGALHADLQLI